MSRIGTINLATGRPVPCLDPDVAPAHKTRLRVPVAARAAVRPRSAAVRRADKALKRRGLELGGSDPFIVLADAAVDAAVETAVRARYIDYMAASDPHNDP